MDREAALTFAIDALACHRLTRLIIEDSLFDRPRSSMQRALRAGGHTKLLELADCPWCVSVWCAFGIVAARRYAPRAWPPVARALAAASVAGIVSSHA